MFTGQGGKPQPEAQNIEAVQFQPNIGNQREASRILHSRFGDDVRFGPPETLGRSAEELSPALRTLSKWFATEHESTE